MIQKFYQSAQYRKEVNV